MGVYKEIKIVFSGSLERILVKKLDVLGIKKYTIIPGVKVSWGENIKHLDTHIWPGTDDILIIILEENKVSEFLKVLEILKDNLSYDTKFDISVRSLEYVNI